MPDYERRVRFTREPQSKDPFEIVEEGTKELGEMIAYDSDCTDMLVFDIESNSMSYAFYWEDTERDGPASGRVTTIGNNLKGLNQGAEELISRLENNELGDRDVQEFSSGKGFGTQRVFKAAQSVAESTEQYSLQQYLEDIKKFCNKTQK